jgi:hypothetical protein
MYSIDIIKSDTYQAGRIIRDNFNRDSSLCFSVRGCVLHSGIHRSTIFISASNPFHSALRYWHKQEQAAINGLVEAIVDGYGEEQAEENACKKARPEWTFERRTRKGFQFIAASRRDGALAIHHSADSWREIHYLTK